MEIQITHGNEMVVALSGRLDTTTSIELSKRLEAEEINEPLVIFDLKETEYISSATDFLSQAVFNALRW